MCISAELDLILGGGGGAPRPHHAPSFPSLPSVRQTETELPLSWSVSVLPGSPHCGEITDLCRWVIVLLVSYRGDGGDVGEGGRFVRVEKGKKKELVRL